MKLNITFKHLEHTPALDERIREKSEKFNKFFSGDLDVKWVCWVDPHGKQWAEVVVHGSNFDCVATAGADTLYKAFDDVVEKCEKQLEKLKSKRRDRIHGHEGHKYHDVG
jgi:putative sigma-54 modulation protein